MAARRRAWRGPGKALRALTLSAIVTGCARNGVDAGPRADGGPSATASAVPSPEAPPALPPTPSASVPVEALGSLRPGDIVFQTSRSAQSAAVQRATRSPLSHMGLVLPHGGGLFVYEAVGPVKYTSAAEWIARGADGRVVVKRLRAPPSSEDVDRLVREAEAFRGKPYDAAFGWGDDRLYCSELVWKTYQRALGLELGALSRLRDFDLGDPLVQAKLHERYGARIPLDEPVIAPAAIAASALLVDVPVR